MKYKVCYALGFSRWKRVFSKPFLLTIADQVVWIKQAPSSLPAAACVVSWGVRFDETVQPWLYMEDAFIHSAGLGSDLVPPKSLVIDDEGLYFDARRPNRLIRILNAIVLDEKQSQRAQQLIDTLIQQGISKYNLGRSAVRWQRPVNQRVLLVPGQVVDDASVRLGARVPYTMQQLLLEVRQANPDAFIVYKPHPDVLSGNRQGLIDAQVYCDQLDSKADIVSLIEACDEVHTLTSLAGFDALLRGKAVVTYGMPFYAGWGLTQDVQAEIPFRQTKVNLQTLVYAALIAYPIYWDWGLNRPSSVEEVVAQLTIAARQPRQSELPRAMRLLRNGFRWCRNITYYYFGWQFKEVS